MGGSIMEWELASRRSPRRVIASPLQMTALGPHLITSDHPMSFRIVGGLTKTIGLDGVKIIVSADMHGDVLVMHCRRRSKQAPEGTYTFRRYLEGDKMVVEVVIDEDKTARRVFVQKSK